MDKLDEEKVKGGAKASDKDVETGDSAEEMLDALKVKNTSLSKRIAILERDLERKTDEQVTAIEENETILADRMKLEKRLKKTQKDYEFVENELKKQKDTALKASDELNIRIQEIDSRNKHLEDELEQTVQAREEAQKKISETEEDRNKIQKKLSALVEENQQSQEQIKTVEQKIKEAEESNSKLVEDLEGARKQADDLNGTVTSLKETVEKNESELQERTAKEAVISDELEKAREELDKVSKQSAEFGERAKKLQGQIDQREKDFTGELNELNRQVEDLKQEKNELEAERVKAIEELKGLKDAHSSLEDEAGELRSRVEIISKDLDRRTSEQAAASGRAMRLERENAQLVETNAKLTSGNEKLTKQMQEVEKLLSNSKTELQELSENKSESDARVQELADESESVSERLRNLTRDLESKSKELDAAQSRIEAFDGERNALKEKWQSEADKVQGLENQVSQLEEEVARGFKQVKDAAEQLQNVTNQLLDVRKENQALRSKSSSGTATNSSEVEQFKSREAEYQQKIDALSDEVKALNEQLDNKSEPESGAKGDGDGDGAGSKDLEAINVKLAAAEKKERQQANLIVALKDEVARMQREGEDSGKGDESGEAAELRKKLDSLQKEHKALVDEIRNSPEPATEDADEEFENLQAERDELIRSKLELENLLKAYKGGASEDSLNEEVADLEKRKAEISSELAQAKMTIMDAANIMNKNREMQDEMEKIRLENESLKQCVIMPTSADELTSQGELSAPKGIPPSKGDDPELKALSVAPDSEKPAALPNPDAGMKLKSVVAEKEQGAEKELKGLTPKAEEKSEAEPSVEEPESKSVKQSLKAMDRVGSAKKKKPTADADADADGGGDSKLKLKANAVDDAKAADRKKRASKSAFSKSLFGSVRTPKKK